MRKIFSRRLGLRLAFVCSIVGTGYDIERALLSPNGAEPQPYDSFDAMCLGSEMLATR
jgi:hypothetical protein